MESGLVTGIFEIPLVHHLGRTPQRSKGAATRTTSTFVGDEANRLVEHVVQALLDVCPRSHRKLSPASNDDATLTEFIYNPMVICGPSGTGKSLLANCLAGLWKRRLSQLPESADKSDLIDSVCVLSAADWAREYAQAVELENVAGWRARRRQSSLLVIDDLHLLRKRENAQRELVDLIDDLVESNVPVIATSSVAPTASESIHPRLSSRLSAGLTLELNPPGPDARLQIIQTLATTQKQPLSLEAAQWFAEKQTGTVPSIRNALAGCLSRSDDKLITDCEISQSRLRTLFDQWQSELRIPIKIILRIVARYCQANQKEMLGASRKQPVVQARSIAMFLAKKYSSCSLREIGKFFGDRDHTTVLHACNKIQDACANDPTTRLAIDELQRIIGNERSSYEH